MRLARKLLAALTVVLAATALPAVHSTAGADPAGVRDQVLDALGRSGAGRISARVHVDGMGDVVDLRSADLLLPASTQKLYTAAAALLELGPDARLRTEVRVTAPPAGNVVHGDVVLVGGGDPSLTGDDILALAARARQAGVAHVTGNVVVDDTLFDRARGGPGWARSMIGVQSGPLSALSVDENRYRRDRVFLDEPAHFAGEVFRMALGMVGTGVAGSVVVARPSTSTVPVAHHLSPPMHELVRPVLKASDNFWAEKLFKVLSAPLGNGTYDDGMAAVGRVTDRLGVPRSGGVDGSGLSRRSSTTAWNQVALLKAVRRTAVGQQFKASLSLACHDGTLRARMCATAAAGRTFAKTGTLDGVVTLAGYTRTADGRTVTFSFLLNGVPNPARARDAIDLAVVRLAESRG